MRAIFSVLGLLLVLVVVGLLAKKQLAPLAAVPSTVVPMAPASASGQPLPQQVKQAVDAALQQPRAMPDEKP
ncbi:hypothetical protein [Rhodoferax sp.]|uniref:hypothetical protein n=1 Tax=Rhodoferax sp. TaxID=50421 RepID=UPI00374D4CD0